MEHQLQTSVSATTPAYGSLVRKAPLARAQARTYFDSADWQLSKQQSAAHGADGMAVQSVAANDWRALQALVAQPSDAATAARATQQQAAATTRHHHYQQQQLGMPGVVTGTMPLKNKVVRRPSRLGTATNATCHVQC